MDTTQAISTSKKAFIETLWLDRWNAFGAGASSWEARGIIPVECLASSDNQPWPIWKTLNRLRVGHGRCLQTLHAWGLSPTSKCECGSEQNMQHLMQCRLAPQCSDRDLAEPSYHAISCATHWKDVI